MTELAKALRDLERQIKAAPDPSQKKPEPLTLRSVHVRDAEHRLLHTIIERSDGARFRRTYRRDAEYRLIETVTEEEAP